MLSTDFLIIGAGSAGLACALELAELGRVTVLSKGSLELSASDWAQGGIAAVLPDSDDSVAQHVADTVRAGAGLCEPNQVTEILGAAPRAIQRLLDWGVIFDRQGDRWQLTREGGHQARRVLHRADHTGRSITRALLRRAAADARIQLQPNTLVGALQQDDTRVTGAWLRHADGQWQSLRARAVILATGGLGQVYRHTSNPDVASGDGIDLAWRAGVAICDLEFVQFHPTTLYSPGESAFLLTEALRGEGAILRLPNGERFMSRHDTRGELAPRDVVSRAIIHEMQEHHLDFVELDISHAPAQLIEAHFPTIAQHCRARGYDPGKVALPVVPAAHYSCGGVTVDATGKTGLPGLYAIGEVASTGLHGANRLASNSLLECIVSAHAVYQDLAGVNLPPITQTETDVPGSTLNFPAETIAARRTALQGLMWEKVGILRNQGGMADALAQLQAWEKETSRPVGHLPSSRQELEWQSLLRSALLITRGALLRHESRGCHDDRDFPDLLEPAQHLRQRRDWSQPQASAVGQLDASAANSAPQGEKRP
ncbi:L-aspartate oxidase [Acidithiobacillus sp. IBUN Pt1247-S3]|uniref:L-aspartate oxidase n=1 Tax=Acidithiobacillus sp. IBUN Pt1247-S3 TaxID=3166642 RepID=UPI0034E421BD